MSDSVRITKAEIEAAMSRNRRGRSRSLNLEQVLEMRRLFVRENVPVSTVAEQFNVSIKTAYDAICGRESYSDTLADR